MNAFGVLQYPRRRLYWSKRRILRNEAIAGALSRNRFEQIFSNLHFIDNRDLDPSNKFAKVQSIIDSLNKSFLAYGPTTNCFSIDECIVPYYGRHNAKQFIKGKPVSLDSRYTYFLKLINTKIHFQSHKSFYLNIFTALVCS